MKFKLIRFSFFSVFCLFTFQAVAQDDYKAEIGISAGGSYYLGDANKLPFSNLNTAFNGFLRYNFNPRLAARAELTYTTINGDGFLKHLIFSDFCGEFNFFELGKDDNKPFSKTFSPYIFAGVGMMGFNSSTGNPAIEYTIPFGVGFKVKLADRWNLNIQWSNRLLLADNMEGTTIHSIYNNSNNLNGSNFLNNDLLSTLTVGVSFDIWKKHCDCENSSTMKIKNRYIK